MNTHMYTTLNPLFNDKKLDSLNNKCVKQIDNYVLKNKFTKVYGICLRPLTGYHEDFYKNDITYVIKQKITTSYMIYEIPSNILQNYKIKLNLVLLEKAFVDKINPLEYETDEYNLCILFLNLKYTNLKPFINQFHYYSSFDDVIKLCITNQYYDITMNKYIINKLMNLFKNIAGHLFWSNQRNTMLNQTLAFLNRKIDFRNSYKIKDTKIKKIVNDISKNLPEHSDYLSYMYNSFFDISQAIRTKGYTFYKMSNDTKKYTNQEFDIFIDQYIDHNNNELFNRFFVKLLENKNLCHLALKSKFIKKFNFYSESNETKFRYVFLVFLLEENIRKSYTERTDRHMFTLTQLNNLPIWKINPIDVLDHPLFPQLIDKKVIDIRNNFLSVHFDGSIVSKNEYKRRMNIFITGNSQFNVFENFKNWKNFAITGSINAAIIPKYNGIFLQYYFNKKIYEDDYSNISIREYLDIALDNYYKKQLKNSDVDIMNNNPSWVGFLEDINNLQNTIDTNTTEISEIKFNKTICIIVNENFIQNYIFDIKNIESKQLQQIINEKIDIKTKIYKFYKRYQILENEKYIQKDIFKDPYYNIFFKFSSIEDMFILVKKTSLDWINYFKMTNNKEKPPKYTAHVDKLFEFKIDNCLCGISINLKGKLYNKKLVKPLELFKIKIPNFAGVVSRFHIDPVRAMYQGPIPEQNKTDIVYVFPSAYASYCTGFSRDLKYFAGKRDHMEILNKKHQQLGYGTPLNTREKIHASEYSFKIDEWKKSYNISTIALVEEYIFGEPNGKYIFDIEGNRQYRFSFDHPETKDWLHLINSLLNKEDNDINTNEYQIHYNKLFTKSIVGENGYLKVYKS
jgi:hypothetical protein